MSERDANLFTFWHEVEHGDNHIVCSSDQGIDVLLDGSLAPAVFIAHSRRIEDEELHGFLRRDNFAKLRSLRWITLTGCCFHHFPPFGGKAPEMRMLEGLDLSSNHICDVDAIAHFIQAAPNLLYLDLRRNPVTYDENVILLLLRINQHLSVINGVRVLPSHHADACRGRLAEDKDLYEQLGQWQVYAALRTVPRSHLFFDTQVLRRTVKFSEIRAIDFSGLDLVAFSFATFPGAVCINLRHNKLRHLVLKGRCSLSLLDVRDNPLSPADLDQLRDYLHATECRLLTNSGAEGTAVSASALSGRGAPVAITDDPYGSVLRSTFLVYNRAHSQLFVCGKPDPRVEFCSGEIRHDVVSRIRVRFVEGVTVLHADPLVDGAEFLFPTEQPDRPVFLYLLTKLDLSHCKIHTIRPISSQCYHLKELNLSDNYISDLSDLERTWMIKLKKLDISDQHTLNTPEGRKTFKLEEIRYLSNLPGLKILLIDLENYDDVNKVFEELRLLSLLNGILNIIKWTPAQNYALFHLPPFNVNNRQQTEHPSPKKKQFLNINAMSIFHYDFKDSGLSDEIKQYTRLLPIREAVVAEHPSVKVRDALDFNLGTDTVGTIAVTDQDRVDQRREPGRSLDLSLVMIGPAILQECVQQAMFAYQYVTTTNFSRSPIGSYVYCFSKMALYWSSFSDKYNMHISEFARCWWLVICSLGPFVFMKLVDLEVSERSFFTIGQRHRFVPVAAVILSLLVIIGLFVGFDYLINKQLNFWTYSIIVFLAIVLCIVSIVVLARYIPEQTRKGDFAKLRVQKERFFMFFVMILQMPLLTFFIGLVTTFTYTSVLGIYALAAAVLLTFHYGSSFYQKISKQVNKIVGGTSSQDDKESAAFDETYHLRVQFRTPDQHLYKDYTYRGRYTEVFDLCHRFLLTGAVLLPERVQVIMVLLCAVVELLYWYFWWPYYMQHQGIYRTMAAFAHLFMAIDAVLINFGAPDQTTSLVLGKIFGLGLNAAAILVAAVGYPIEQKIMKARSPEKSQ